MFFVRQSRGGDWGQTGVPSDNPGAFPTDVLADVIDRDGETSIWEVKDLETESLIEIAAALQRSDVKNVTEMFFRPVTGDQLTSSGLEFKRTTGLSLNIALNKSGTHWVVKTPKVNDVLALAKLLAVQNEIMVARTQVLFGIAKGLADGNILFTKITPDLLKKVHAEGYLKCLPMLPKSS